MKRTTQNIVLTFIGAFFGLLPGISLAQSANYTEHISKETDIEMILVHGGKFDMGSNAYDDAKPVHSVSLGSYYISKYEITQQQWYVVMNYPFSRYYDCPQCPVTMVSWGDAQLFISRLNDLIAKRYRLPTEAEWEYAARGGSQSGHYTYSGSNNISQVAWTWEDVAMYGRDTHPVGKKQPNELGIYDMTGNVLEWCSDWYDSTYYQQKVSDNPKGPSTGKFKVIRGGNYISNPGFATVAYRERYQKIDTGAHWITLGFRIVRDYVK